MKTVYDRTAWMIGKDKVDILKGSKVIVFGAGGVGGGAIEALARAGVGTISIVDFDVVDITNINRQILALQSTVGRDKTQVAEERIKDINPEINVKAMNVRLTVDNICEFEIDNYDYIIDAIDDVLGKLTLINKAKELDVPIICSMGTGNKLDPFQFKIVDISKTHTCPLAKKIRKELRNSDIKHLEVLFSTEEPERKEFPEDGSKSPASISFVPPVAGLMIGGHVIKRLINVNIMSSLMEK